MYSVHSCATAVPDIASSKIQTSVATRMTFPPCAVLLFGGCDRFDADGLGFRVKGSSDGHFFAGELFRFLLVAQGVRFLAVKQDVLGSVRVVAGKCAFGVRRSHPHPRMIGGRTHDVSDRAGEGLLSLCG